MSQGQTVDSMSLEFTEGVLTADVMFRMSLQLVFHVIGLHGVTGRKSILENARHPVPTLSPLGGRGIFPWSPGRSYKYSIVLSA